MVATREREGSEQVMDAKCCVQEKAVADTVGSEDEGRRAVYAFFAHVLLDPIPVPGTEFVDDLALRIQALSAVEGLDPAIEKPLERFLARCAGDRAQLQQQLAIDRSALFRATRQTEGPLPPYEAFQRADRPEHTTMQELNAFYARFGSGIAEGVHERPDYLGIESAFMAELVRASLAARAENGDTEPWQRAQSDFLGKHIGCWAPACCDRLIPHAQTDAFRGLLALYRDFLEDERMRFCER